MCPGRLYICRTSCTSTRSRRRWRRDVHVLPTYIYDGTSNPKFGFSLVVYHRITTELPDSLKPWPGIEHTNSTVRGRTYGGLAGELVAGLV